MGWGIRGQYGHETGAMIAGLLIGLVLTHLLCPNSNPWSIARAVAWCTVAIGFGGSMTYGQTIGLTQDADLIGDWDALRWGMLGLAVKGSLWIGFAGVFFGIGLSRIRYAPGEMLLVMAGLVCLFVVGIWLFNSPYSPSERVLPKIYFSADWTWKPNVPDLKPRREVWGGLVLGLLGIIGYAGFYRRDRLARNLAMWGMVGGALGFPGGQCLQAFHAWNLDGFRQGIWASFDPNINWWNMMEITFGMIAGGSLGLGLWLNRSSIGVHDKDQPNSGTSMAPWNSPLVELLLVIVHVTILMMAEFGSVPVITFLYAYGVVMGIIPIVANTNGRWWPYLTILPITLAPIVGKTIRQLVYKTPSIESEVGWLLYFVLPMVAACGLAAWLALRSGRTGVSSRMTRIVLLFSTWLYFGLNYAFFNFPWPWQTWTGRTPSALIFLVCACGLTWCAVSPIRKSDSGTC